MPYLSASAVVIHYEEALYQMYGPLPFTFKLYIYIYILNSFWVENPLILTLMVGSQEGRPACKNLDLAIHKDSSLGDLWQQT